MNPGPRCPGTPSLKWEPEVEDPPELQSLRAVEACLHFVKRNLNFARQRKTRLQPELRALSALADELWIRACRAAQDVREEAERAASEDRERLARATAEWRLARAHPEDEG